MRVKLIGVATKSPRTERRADALSEARIVEAAIELLDSDGENALTRAIASGWRSWHSACSVPPVGFKAGVGTTISVCVVTGVGNGIGAR